MRSLLGKESREAARGRASRSAPSTMRPFFGFYGGKWRDAPKYYPAPEHDTIVEPFAGSAGYSVRYADRNVILGEKDAIIFGVWDYLIRVPAHDILAIPDLAPGQTVADLPICQEAPMARRVLAEPRRLTPADRAVGVDARWHPSRVFLGRTGTPDHRCPGRPHPPLAGVQLLVRGTALFSRGHLVRRPAVPEPREALPPRPRGC